MEINNSKYQVHFTSIFVALYITQLVVLNRLVGNNSVYLTGGTFIYFVTPLVSDIIAEVYGLKAVKSAINLGCILMLVSSILITISLNLPYPDHWSNVITSYHISLDSVLRTAISGVIMILIGQRINAYLLLKWKTKMNSKYFFIRSVLSSVIGDAITVSLTSILVFSGRINNIREIIFSNIIPELIVMTLIAIIGGFIATYIVFFVKKLEGIVDSPQAVSNFNPFKD